MSKLTKKKPIKIRLRLRELTVDPHPYKPFSPTFEPPEELPLYVEFEIDKGNMQAGLDSTVLDEVAYQRLLEVIAVAVAFAEPTRVE